MTLLTLPDLSKITSLTSPIFSFASLYTSTPASLEPRHSPSLCVVALVVCADAGPVITAARNAIASHLEIMMFLRCLENQANCGTLVPAGAYVPAGSIKQGEDLAAKGSAGPATRHFARCSPLEPTRVCGISLSLDWTSQNS